ncbi:uncharacterized protein PAC_13563 [Phialocephala subalpina]|uniref:Uncharacterized protein n=1 Tax=Phialocephala subalpina TaxID=576137 RepID=A0A1L7XFB8_9HELO|nr:uncharacterized protein PAC_13563 [Phialocephala subalpina]
MKLSTRTRAVLAMAALELGTVAANPGDMIIDFPGLLRPRASAVAAASSTNLLAFSSALGGQAVEPVTSTGDSTRPFAVGTDTFTDFSTAATRSCNNQHNACATVANGSNKGTLTVGQCDTQQSEFDSLSLPLLSELGWGLVMGDILSPRTRDQAIDICNKKHTDVKANNPPPANCESAAANGPSSSSNSNASAAASAQAGTTTAASVSVSAAAAQTQASVSSSSRVVVVQRETPVRVGKVAGWSRDEILRQKRGLELGGEEAVDMAG